MAKKRNSALLDRDPGTDRFRRSAEDFPVNHAPVRSFFAAEYLRTTAELRFPSVSNSETWSAFDLPAGSALEYEYDINRLGVLYHKCAVEIDGRTYHILLTPDQIEVVRPI